MAHTITPEAGSDLAPSAGHTLAAEGGASLGPSAGHTLAAEGGASLGPSAGHTLAAEGGASLAPSAPGQIAAEGEAIPIGTALLVYGTLTTDGTTPLVFPLMLPMEESVEGRPAWSSTGGAVDSLGDGDYAILYDAGEFSWMAWVLDGIDLRGFAGGTTEMSPLDVVTWGAFGSETGTPVFSLASPKQISAEGGASLSPSAGHTLAAEGGASLSPASGHTLAAEAGASLSPAAPAQITAESIY